MPTIAVREPEQLSLFDLLESSGARTESAQPHIIISTIRQKYLAHNHVIRNRAMTEFIERWHRQLNAA